MTNTGLIVEKPSCNECKYAIFQDHGYSNYTVEGTEFICAKKLHPYGDFDRWYGEDTRLNYAAECGGFESGDSIDLDVEHEDLEGLTPEQKAIYEEWNKS